MYQKNQLELHQYHGYLLLFPWYQKILTKRQNKCIMSKLLLHWFIFHFSWLGSNFQPPYVWYELKLILGRYLQNFSYDFLKDVIFSAFLGLSLGHYLQKISEGFLKDHGTVPHNSCLTRLWSNISFFITFKTFFQGFSRFFFQILVTCFQTFFNIFLAFFHLFQNILKLDRTF